MEKGELVTDDLVVGIIDEEGIMSERFILDGLPRIVVQVEKGLSKIILVAAELEESNAMVLAIVPPSYVGA
ncbi:hypothetical protein IFM89_025855 [Coptis chinensis]|uniref:Uncharacterized protein n=1 Tax=Coptis chinensis TaxID=261450 RepID=A0A835HYJ5_9MAGN|nr:hypothetical protein IFM89_025855 [Coptis chinensis]